METQTFEHGYENLEAWRKAMDLIVSCYDIARGLPKHETYGLAAQIRRAAISVAANIAEGCGRVGNRDRLRFLSYARGSICELRTLFAAVERLMYARAEDLSTVRDLLQQVGRLTNGLRRRFLRLSN